MIDIRELVLGDVIQYSSVLVGLLNIVLFENIKGCDAQELSQKYYEDMIEFSKDGTAILIGAFDEDKLVGFHWGYEIQNLDHKRMHSYFVSIEPQYRGQHIGSRMYEKLEEISVRRGIYEIEAMCTASNEGAVQYHLHNDFEIERYKVVKKIKQREF